MAAAVVAFFVITHRLWLFDCLFREDAWDAYWPWFSYMASSLGQGRFPLWDPHSGCGFPFHANPQAGTFYPVYWAAALVFGGGYKVFQCLWIGHWLFGTAGLFLLARRLGLGPPAAGAASISFGFCGYFIGNAEHTAFINVICYLPWILLALEAWQDRPLRAGIAGGALLGMAGLSGYPGVLVFTVIMLAAWCALAYGLRVRTALAVLVTLAVGGLIVSPAYLSFLVEVGEYTHRAGPLDVREACHVERFPMAAMISMLVPRFALTYPDMLDCHYSMADGYLGVIGLAALGLAALYRPIRTRWKWLLLWILIAWLLSLGSEGGLRVLGYYALPPLRYMRHSALFRAFWLCGGAIVVGAVVHALVTADDQDRIAIVDLLLKLLAAMAGLLALVFIWALMVPERASLEQALALTAGPAALIMAFAAVLGLYRQARISSNVFLVLVLLTVGADAASHFTGNMGTVCANGSAARFAGHLQQIADSCAGQTLTGNENRSDAPLLHPNMGCFDRKFYVRSYNPASSPVYDFLVGGSVGGHAGAPLRTPFLSVLETGPRFWLSPGVVYAAEGDDRARAWLRVHGADRPLPIIVHSRTAAEAGAGGAPVVKGTFGRVEVLGYAPEEITLSVDAPAKAWLFCTERYCPGWKAYVDGAPVPIHKACFCFRALQVPEGRHMVRMVYEPRVHRPLWLLSWSLLALSVILCQRTRKHVPARDD